MSWIYLALAILFELLGTFSMKTSEGFSRLWPSVSAFISYGMSSATLILALRTLPLGVAYAIWSGVGTACAVGIGCYFFGETFTPVKFASTALIVAGVIGLHLE